MKLNLTHTVRYQLLIISVVVIFSSCKKKEFTIPSEVNIQFQLNEEFNDNGSLAFSNGELTLGEIRFDGERSGAPDYFFESKFETGYSAKWGNVSSNSTLSFDVPQGTYQLIEISINLLATDSVPGLWVEGLLNYQNGGSIPIRVEIKEDLFMKLLGEDDAGNRQIILTKDVPSTAVITFHPTTWFGTINRNSLERARKIPVNGINTIMISDKLNVFLYEVVINRIEQSTTLTFVK